MELISVAALMAPVGGIATVEDEPPLGQWFVLYHRDTSEVRIEVSKAAGIDERGEDPTTGQFTGWLIRVMLEPFRPESAAIGQRPLDVGGDDVDFTIIPAS